MADYAISNVPRRVVYAASGVGPYAFTFEILDETDISVYRGSTLLTLTTDYTVTINANGTGSVTLVTTAGTSNVTIVGAKNIQRTSDFTTGGDLFANTLNDELDNQTIFIQQVAETAERGLKAPVTDPTDIAMTLPAKDGRKGKVLAFDSTTGNPVAGPSLDSMVTVIEQSAYINAVGENIADVIAVADNEANIDIVAGVSSNVTTVAGSISNVNTVADDLNEPVSEIHTVGTNIANVNAVGTNIANVNSVAGNATNINAVAGNSTNINAVAGNATNINTVAGNNTNINTVAGISANVTSVAGNASNINQVAADTVAINAASANAATATTKAAEALASANSASASAAAASAVALGNEPVRHSVRPSLLLDFANTKTLDPRITFTRASTGTFYDGKTTAKAEENLQVSSQVFNNSSWQKVETTATDNAVVAPDGTTTASTIATSNNNLPVFVRSNTNSVSSVSGQPVVISIFAKANTHSFLQIIPESTILASAFANFDLSAGTVGTSGGTGLTASIVSVGNSWYRCIVTISSASGSGRMNFYLVDSSSSARASNYTGTVGNSLYLWGAQAENRSSVTAYTATTTAPITNYIPALQTAAANIARFEHNPVTGESLGLEIEEQRTNLFTDSSTVSVSVNVSIQYNTAVSPDGAISADLVVPDTSSSVKQVTKSASLTAGTQYSMSFYAKQVNSTFVGIGGSFSSTFAGSGGTFTAYLNNPSSSSGCTVTPVGNGWYRITDINFTPTVTVSAGVFFRVLNTSGLSTGVGNNYDGILMWGFQIEAGSFATSYIPTVASQVTRSADSASMTGTNFSSWYRADEGTLYGETSTPLSGGGTPFVVSDGSNNNKVQLISSSSRQLYVAISNVAQADLDGGTITLNQYSKIAGAYKTDDFAVSVSGGAVVTDSSGRTPIVDRAYIGINSDGSGSTSTIKKLAYYPLRLTNAELQGLTTV